MSEVVAVLLCFGDEHRESARRALAGVLARAFPRAGASLVIVDNALGGDIEEVIDKHTVAVSGDNRCREFSGWERGLSVARRWPHARAVVLANDTLHRSYGEAWLAGFSERRVTSGLAAGALIGWVDAYPNAVDIAGLPLRRWVRTSLFMTTPATLQRLQPLGAPAPDADLFGAHDLFTDGAPLSPRYRAYLRAWITGDGADVPEFPFRWHSAAPLTSENRAAAQGKIRSILAEHFLSAHAASLGIPLVDVR
jgi:hypothetical protein